MAANTTTRISPFELLFATPMNVGHLTQTTPTSTFTGDQKTYLDFLASRLADIRKGIAENLVEAKTQDKQAYDKRFSVKPNKFSLGVALLLDRRIKGK
jgi:hypothetical protein